MSPDNDSNKVELQNNNQQDIELEYDEYLDDEPQRKPKHGKALKKFRHPLEY